MVVCWKIKEGDTVVCGRIWHQTSTEQHGSDSPKLKLGTDTVLLREDINNKWQRGSIKRSLSNNDGSRLFGKVDHKNCSVRSTIKY